MKRSIGAALVLTLLVATAGCETDRSSGDDDPEVVRLTAFDICKEFVTDRLRSPGSANFRNFFEDDGEVSVSGFGDGPYVVRSTVDSQNGFGALLRSSFVCTVTRNPTTKSWHLDDIDLDEGG